MGGKSKKKTNTADSFKEQGNSAFNSRDFDRAIASYSKGLELDPNHAILYSNRSAALIEKHKFEEALADAEKAIILNPSYLKAYHRKATSLLELGRPEDSLQVIQTALLLDPSSQDFDEVRESASKEIEANSVLPLTHPERVKFEKLVTWLLEGGSKFPKLQMRFYSEDYRGVHSTCFVNKDELILFIPKSHIITLEMAKASPIGKKMVEADLDLLSPKHSFLTTFVLQEKQKEVSFWQPYLEILPQKFRNFPIFFTEDEKEWLKGSPFLDQVNEKIDDIQVDYNTICKAVPEYSQFPIEEFSKIRMAVSSRIFGMQIDGVKTDGFVPYADMLNHRRPRQTSWNYDQDKGGFVIEALEDINRGDEVLDSYGKKCNSRFLLNYGFINRNNDANEYPFKVVLNEQDEHFNIKKSLLNSTFQTFRLQADLSEQVFSEFLGVLRFSELNDTSLIPKLLQECQDDKNTFRATKVPCLSVKNEKKVIKKFRDLVTEGLARYSTSLEEDKEILKRDLTENQRNCTLMRVGEKEILHYFLEFTDAVLNVIDLPFKEFKKVNKSSKFDEYINGVLLPLKRQ
jgi:histone-lysine N-methyltransferase SETD3